MTFVPQKSGFARFMKLMLFVVGFVLAVNLAIGFVLMS